MVRLFGRRDPVRKQIEKEIIREAVVKEKAKQRISKFEKRKARAIARIRKPPLRGIAVKAGRRARKELGKSLRGFAEKIGKPREAEKETLIIIGGQPKRVKGRVRVIREQQEPFIGGLDLGGDLGLSVDLEGSKKKRRRKELKPMRFF